MKKREYCYISEFQESTWMEMRFGDNMGTISIEAEIKALSGLRFCCYLKFEI